MPHVAIVPFTGFRVREHEMLVLEYRSRNQCCDRIQLAFEIRKRLKTVRPQQTACTAELAGQRTTPLRLNRQTWSFPTLESSRCSRGLRIIAIGSVVIWILILPWTQAEQQLRSQVERDMKHGRVAEALAVMSSHAQSDFPPQWEPPPRIGYGETIPDICT